MSDILTALEPWLVEALVAALTWLGGMAALAIRRYAGERAALIASQALGEAIRRGLDLAAADDAPDAPIEAARYVERMNPGLVKRIGADLPALINRARAELAARKQ